MVLMQLIRFIERKKQTNKKNIDTIYENNKSEKKRHALHQITVFQKILRTFSTDKVHSCV